MAQQSARQLMHDILILLLGSNNVYFQPPPNVELVYPCFVYKYGSPIVNHADNLPYRIEVQFEVTLITDDPDTPLVTTLLQRAKTSLKNSFNSSGLIHFVFTIFI
jgi:hypothetical protein